MDKALSGIRVLDMTHVQAGPTCSQLMGFMGADVIKFEPPTGDVTRKQLRDIPDADSLYFTMLNCNKRSITVNLKNEDGKKIFADLIKSCDVVMENFGPGVLNRLGFGWEEVHKINPRIVMASIKGLVAKVLTLTSKHTRTLHRPWVALFQRPASRKALPSPPVRRSVTLVPACISWQVFWLPFFSASAPARAICGMRHDGLRHESLPGQVPRPPAH